MKVAVCVPTIGTVHEAFCMDLASAVGWHMRYTDIEIELVWHPGSVLARQRQDMCKAAIENGAEFVIQVDSDMRFPRDIFQKLVEHDRPFVGINVSGRRLPLGTNTWRIGSDGQPEQVIPQPGLLGLEEVMTTGFGFVCIRADVFQQIEYPWFQTPFLHDRDRYVGEDQYFCSRLKDAGIPIAIDHTLSWDVRHVGDYEFSMQDVMESWGAVHKIEVA